MAAGALDASDAVTAAAAATRSASSSDGVLGPRAMPGGEWSPAATGRAEDGEGGAVQERGWGAVACRMGDAVTGAGEVII